MSAFSIKNKTSIYIIFLLFFMMFCPPIIPVINIIIPIYIFCGIALFVKYKKDIKEIFIYSQMKMFFSLFIIFFIYLFIIIIINISVGNGVELSNYIIESYRFGLLLLATSTCILYLICNLKKINCKPENLLILLIAAASIESVLTVLSLIFPSVKQFFVEIMLSNTDSKVIATKPWEVNQRFFGFANDMLDIFGYGVGILSALPIYFAIYKKNLKYLLFVPFLLLTVFFNSRTGLIIFAIGLLCSLPTISLKSKKQKVEAILVFFLFIIVSIVAWFVFSKYYPNTIKWIAKDFPSIFEFLFTGKVSEGQVNTATLLFSERFWNFPPFPDIIFGTGHTIYSVKGFANSDVGYVNDLWLCGIVGCLVLYGAFIYLFFTMWKVSRDRTGKCLAVFIFLSFLVFQIKASGIRFNPGMFCSLILCFYYIYYYNSKNSRDCIERYKSKNYIDEIKRLEITSVISIIVPIYKVEKYLEKCIDSIINQDYKNLEIILVDDGSPDRCPQICDEYAQKDSRIKVIHKENGGLSDARNAGIKVATGEYIAFIDSDDYVTENYISTLLYTIKKYDADISACNYIKLYEDSGVEKVEPKTTKDLVMTNIEAMKDLFTLPNNSDVVAWNKLYKTSLFTQNNIEFPKGKLHEDNFTTYKLYYFSNKVVFTNVPCYYYLQRKDSIMGKKFNIKRLDILLALKETEEFVKENNIDLNQEVKFNELLRLLTVLNSMVDTKCINKKVFEDIRTMIRKDKEVYLKNHYLRVKHKVAVKSLISSRKLYIIIRKLFVFKNKYI